MSPDNASADVARYDRIDQSHDPEFYIRLMDLTRGVPSLLEVKDRLLSFLEPRPGEQFLDVGCGTGEDARRIAAYVGPDGIVLGVDRSEAMIAEARRRSSGSGLPVTFRNGDACQLELEDGSVDGCHMDRTLVHVDDPARAIAELVRVTRPGGRVAISEGDGGDAVVTGCDPTLTARLIGVFSARLRHGRIGCRLAQLCEEAGLTDIQVWQPTLALPSALFIPMVSGSLEAATQAGDVKRRDVRAWWDQLSAAERDGKFFCSIPGFVVGARRP